MPTIEITSRSVVPLVSPSMTLSASSWNVWALVRDNSQLKTSRTSDTVSNVTVLDLSLTFKWFYNIRHLNHTTPDVFGSSTNNEWIAYSALQAACITSAFFRHCSDQTHLVHFQENDSRLEHQGEIAENTILCAKKCVDRIDCRNTTLYFFNVERLKIWFCISHQSFYTYINACFALLSSMCRQAEHIRKVLRSLKSALRVRIWSFVEEVLESSWLSKQSRHFKRLSTTLYYKNEKNLPRNCD